MEEVERALVGALEAMEHADDEMANLEVVLSQVSGLGSDQHLVDVAIAVAEMTNGRDLWDRELLWASVVDVMRACARRDGLEEVR